MDIRFEYTRKRSEFGRPCSFSDSPAEVTVDIPPDPSLASDFIPQDPVDCAVQHGPEMAVSEVNTDRVQVKIQGVNHVEGGWPKHVDPKNSDLTTRYREEVERDENYTKSILRLSALIEHCIRQNNAIDIYEEYFEEDEEEEMEDETPSAKTIGLLRDPNPVRRMVTHFSWHPDANKELAVAYCSLDFQDKRRDMSFNSYIWDPENPYKPELTLVLSSPVVTLEYNPKDWYLLLGGCYNGQMGEGNGAGEGGSLARAWLQHCCTHRMVLLVFQSLHLPLLVGPRALAAAGPSRCPPPHGVPILLTAALSCSHPQPAKFLVGTEQGSIISCNRDAKTPPDKIGSVFKGHIGAVYAVARNPFFPKTFLSVGDWTARIWTEELPDSPSIMATKYHIPYLLDGCWSPVKPAVFFTSRSDGIMDVWDFLFHQKEPCLSLKVSNDPLFSLCPQDNGRVIACGSKTGNVTILEISSGLYTLRKNEKSLTSTMLEREMRREKVLQDKQRELLLRQQEQARAQAQAEAEEKEDPQAIFEQARSEFFNIIESERQKR
ncbi:DYI3 protein, partial [Smithornis capensis]|nr:DYI3 protein [Smithornis capensis]